jgi:hypothetical protein
MKVVPIGEKSQKEEEEEEEPDEEYPSTPLETHKNPTKLKEIQAHDTNNTPITISAKVPGIGSFR